MTKVLENGIERDATAEELAQAETDRVSAEAEATASINAKTKSDADAKAGNDKLIELGLTQDQVTAMTGYTPPTPPVEV